MRVSILPYAIILTKAHRAAVNMMVKESIVTRVLPLRCFLVFTTQLYLYYAAVMQYFSYFDKRE